MKKKILLMLLSLVCVFAALGLTACDESESSDLPKEPVSFTVTFETDGGTPIDPITVNNGSKKLKTILDGKTTEKAEKVFDGWYTDASCNYEADLDEFIDGT